MAVPENVANLVRSPWIERHRKLAYSCVALTGLATMMLLTVANRDTWSVDFNQFYVAGSLAGTGHLYDWNAVRAMELKRTNATPFIRLPVFAFAMKAFSALPYSLARVLFLCLEIAALLGFIALWPFSKRTFAFAAVCWSVPVAMCRRAGTLVAPPRRRLLGRSRAFDVRGQTSSCAADPGGSSGEEQIPIAARRSYRRSSARGCVIRLGGTTVAE